MENTIQPILCCVGVDVAGEPTQFLMERTATAAHLDWHVITVEIANEQLAKAWDGMCVMRFRAVRFFRPLQAAAMQLVAEPTPEDRFIGGVTSALRIGDQWSMWHHSGPAMVQLLADRVPWSQSVCWLHGNSPQVRSLLVASASTPPRMIVWTGTDCQIGPSASAAKEARPPGAGQEEVSDRAPGELSSSVSHTDEPSAHIVKPNQAVGSELERMAADRPEPLLDNVAQSESESDPTRILPTALAARLPLIILPTGRESELPQWLSNQLEDDNPPAALVHAGDVEPRHLETILGCQPTANCTLVVVNRSPGTRRKLVDGWKAGQVHVIGPDEVIVAEEAYDQSRWTGQNVNVDVVREAYEEYAEF